MYEFLRGKIVDITPAYIVVDVNGVGYHVLMGNPFTFDEGQTATVYVQLIIRDTDQTLYGFASRRDKQLFNQLLSVTGIGPKSALAIQANAQGDALASAIANNDVAFLTKFPGVGKKTASQIVLDLQGKVAVPLNGGQPALDLSAGTDDDLIPALRDALSALTALGYTDGQVKKVRKVLVDMPDSSTQEYLQAGLKALL